MMIMEECKDSTRVNHAPRAPRATPTPTPTPTTRNAGGLFARKCAVDDGGGGGREKCQEDDDAFHAEEIECEDDEKTPRRDPHHS